MRHPADLSPAPAAPLFRPAAQRHPEQIQADQRREQDALALPLRWRRLRQQSMDEPAFYWGTAGMNSWSRGLGWRVERELRAVRPALAWHYDPSLDLELIAGLDDWDSSGRGEETAAEFREITASYRDLLKGTVFPPLLTLAVDPAADRRALGRSLQVLDPDGWQLAEIHYALWNGRHRARAARKLGLRTFPAFVITAAGIAALDESGADAERMSRSGARIGRAAGARGRQGVRVQALEGLAGCGSCHLHFRGTESWAAHKDDISACYDPEDCGLVSEAGVWSLP